MQVMWNRLIAVVEEQAQTLIRTAFCTAVREAGDLSAGVFDPGAACRAGGHRHAGPRQLDGHVGRAFPRRSIRWTMQPGDVYLTNDPWLSTGHLYDFTVVTPVFKKGRLVALFASTAHVVDIGGIGFGADGRSVFEEGLCIPIMPLAEAGSSTSTCSPSSRPTCASRSRSRAICYSLAACNETGCRRLVEMMDEFGSRRSSEIARVRHRQFARGDAGGDRQAAEGHLASQHDGRRLRGADRAQGGADDRRIGHRCRFHRHLAASRLRHQRAVLLHRRLYRASACAASWGPRSRTMRARSPP